MYLISDDGFNTHSVEFCRNCRQVQALYTVPDQFDIVKVPATLDPKFHHHCEPFTQNLFLDMMMWLRMLVNRCTYQRSYILKMEATNYSETLIYRNTRRHTPEYRNLNIHRRVNLKPQMILKDLRYSQRWL
jgi:hypothetical protein